MTEIANRYDPDQPLPMHPLVYLAEGDEVTIGRADIDSYGIFPLDGAAVVRKLADGLSPRQAARWYETAYGERLDVADLVGALDELGLLRDGDGDAPAGPQRPVRWQRLGRALFSMPAWLLYAGLVLAFAITLAGNPDVAPHYRHVFFTDSYLIVMLVVSVGQFPGLLLHESFHMLAGRRLGLRSRLTIGRRLYFLVVETTLDGLVSVPRAQRYLPMLAGMLADVLWLCALTLAAALAGHGVAAGICLALAASTVLRLLWQFFLFMRTDLYAVVSTVFGCVDLHAAARRTLHNRINGLLGRRDRVVDDSTSHPTDRRVARWYSWLMVAGYLVLIATLALAVIPAAVLIASDLAGRAAAGSDLDTARLLDSVALLGLAALQLAVVAGLAIRDRRRRRAAPAPHHLVA